MQFVTTNSIKQNINTAKNPKTNIFYGRGFSKFIFEIDISDLKQKLESGEYVLTTTTKHYLHLKNTVFDREFNRATNFDLNLYLITEPWDEGIGSDYYGDETRASNWVNRTTLEEWAVPGIDYEDFYKTIHFETGAEDIYTDITDYVNQLLTDEGQYYGLCLCFPEEYLDINTNIPESVSFYTKYFNEYFQPYVETIFDDVITDNRDNFIAEKRNSLYLYVTKGDNYFDLDEDPIVDILDSRYAQISGLTGLSTMKIRKGIYKVSFGISGQICDGKRFFYGNWKNIKIDGETIDNVRKKFIPKPFINDFDFNNIDNDSYIIQFAGIKQNEQIIRGNKLKLIAIARSIKTKKTILLDEIYCRMFVKEGKTEIVVFDWQQMDKTNENAIFIDTSFLLPCEYFIEIKAVVNGNEYYQTEKIKFEIINDIKTNINADNSVIIDILGFDYTFDIKLS
jgi:hypothetical protein